MELKKPQSKAELRLPFDKIGDPGWDICLKHLLDGYDLQAYDIEEAKPCSEADTLLCEAHLRQVLPSNLRLFLQTLGDVDFLGLKICGPEEIVFLSQRPLRVEISPEQERLCAGILVVAEEVIDDTLFDFYGLEISTGRIFLSSDLDGCFGALYPSFDNFVKSLFIDLSWGLVGWDENYFYDWAEEIKDEELGRMQIEQ